MQQQDRRKVQFKMVLIVSLLIGVATFFFVRHFQKVSDPATRGALPAFTAQVTWTEYGSDADGRHYYSKVDDPKASPGIVRVWTRLDFSDEGRKAYAAKRKAAVMSVEGYDGLARRNVMYELNCFSDKREFSTQEVFDLTTDGKTIDYAKAGTYKDWQEVPQDSVLYELCRIVCPEKK